MKLLLKRIFAAPLLYVLFMKVRPFTRKNILLVLCTAGLVGYTAFTCTVIDRLKRETTGVTQAYAELIEKTVSGNMSYDEMSSVLAGILSKSTNPLIVVDTAWNPIMWSNIHYGFPWRKTISLSEKLTESEQLLVEQKIHHLRRTFNPRPIFFGKPRHEQLGYLVYGNSVLVSSLFLMPFIEIGLGVAFVALLYMAFHSIRITERSNLWVGLAKETAHQLGTPISSMMGWVEYLRTAHEAEPPLEPHQLSEQIFQICDDLDNDLKRLVKVTARFSQIGSIPALAPCDLALLLTDVASYFRMRLPLLKKRIDIDYEFSSIPLVNANRELLEWVFENLLKNSIDAITRDDGIINIRTEYVVCDKVVRIQLTDNGKGIIWEAQKKIFSPGFTTKQRGWGLGLTLAKRIVEDYHKGKIYVAWSQRGKGTVFNIDLPVRTAPSAA